MKCVTPDIAHTHTHTRDFKLVISLYLHILKQLLLIHNTLYDFCYAYYEFTLNAY